ncbi:MarR family winged helix-turn-helix transcriptional regulator [Streptomyces lunaelactis]|uniref:MarR family winged helix-turn-helix transcriptional regulator n=1 Tax=Streptomyces lunaelactis TaxID=1535768 RepID=UPI001C2FE3E3|nr:MarR family transcriptional regulator [Streptomyces lunaelactis]
MLAAELVDLDLTTSEINALANLADGRPRTVSELGAAAGTRPTTLTSVLDRLERRGHITRGARAGDRRAVLVELTPTGRLTADTVQKTLTDLEHRALGGLPTEAVAGFHAVLRALTRCPHDPDQPRPTRSWGKARRGRRPVDRAASDASETTHVPRSFHEVTSSGVTGDTRSATAEKGDLILDVCGSRHRMADEVPGRPM